MDTKPQDESPRAAPPLINIVGEKVALGPLRKDLVPLYARWFNDFSTLRMLGPMPRPLALEQEEQWYKRAITRGDAVIAFTIYEKATETTHWQYRSP